MPLLHGPELSASKSTKPYQTEQVKASTEAKGMIQSSIARKTSNFHDVEPFKESKWPCTPTVVTVAAKSLTKAAVEVRREPSGHEVW
jgi:hypothetical protein